MRIENRPDTVSFEEPSPPSRETVKRAQNHLLRAGFSLTKYGADGHAGRETTAAITRFQQAHALPVTGRLDAKTLEALEGAQSASPDYAALFEDGVLHATLALGHDEANSHLPEQEKLITGLARRGYAWLDPSEKKARGLDVTAQLWERTHGELTIQLELITPGDPRAKERFAKAMERSELILYGGHGRYGSGPDFDDMHSTAGNFVIGAPYEAGHVTLGANDLQAASLGAGYQFAFFDGCSTFRYFDDLAAKKPGLDVLGSNTELYWHVTAANLLTVLDGVSERQDLGALTDSLDAVNEIPHAFRGDGFDDNR
ncbi:MAG TPA: peptidoglycan-binding domain-containing protein [Archangium sp.]